jgi:hypothetical protein
LDSVGFLCEYKDYKKKVFAEGQTQASIRRIQYGIELADPSRKIRLKIFSIIDALCKYVLFTGDEVRRDPSGHLGLIHPIRSAQVWSKGAASKYLPWLFMPYPYFSLRAHSLSRLSNI